MSSVKISSLYEIKNEIARLSRKAKQKTGIEAFNFEMQNHLLDLVKYIRERVNRKLRVNVYIYDDEYTLNYFTDTVRWTIGVDQNGLTNYCYIDTEKQLHKGNFTLPEVPEDFNVILEKLNDKVR